MNSLDMFNKLNELLSKYGEKNGLEFHAFNTCTYNEQVSHHFKLDYPDDTIAFCIISQPRFFEKAFIPFLQSSKDLTSLKLDPLDQCCGKVFDDLKEEVFCDRDVEMIHEFELTATRRPKILVQTAGHVSAAAYYYQQKDVKNDAWDGKKIYGVSFHPRFGGWFAFRGVVIVKDLRVMIDQKLPQDTLSNEQKIQLLHGFNYHWHEFTYRDVNTPEETYSSKQREYFLTKPKERFPLVEKWLKE